MLQREGGKPITTRQRQCFAVAVALLWFAWSSYAWLGNQARADEGALKAIGDEFKTGMVFAMNIDLFDPKWMNGETGCVLVDALIIGRPPNNALEPKARQVS